MRAPGWKTFLGLDAGRHVIKIAHARRLGPFVQITGTARLERSEPTQDARALQALLRDKGWLSAPCVLGVRSDLVAMRILDAPEGGETALRRLASEHMEEFEAFANAPTITRYATYRNAGRHLLLLLAAREDVLREELRLPHKAGLKVCGLVPTPLALQAGTHHLVRNRTPIVCIDIGADGTDWIVTNGPTPLHLWRSPIGGDQLKAPAATPRPRPFDGWLDDMRMAARSFRHRCDQPQWNPTGVLCAGGFSLTAQEKEDIQNMLALPECEWAPPDVIEAPPATYLAAVGLAVGKPKAFFRKIDLLPGEPRPGYPSRVVGHKYRSGMNAALLAAGLALAAAVRESRIANRIRLHQQEQDGIEAALASEVAQVERAMATLRDAVQPMRNAEQQNRTLYAILDAVATARHPQDWIFLIADAFSYSREQREGPPPPPERRRNAMFPDSPSRKEGPQRVVVEGYSHLDDLSSVRTMIESLMSHPAIRTVDLLPDDRIRPRPEPVEDPIGPHARRFVLEIVVEETNP